ncbi:5'-3' exoribonuclease 2 [Giardia muris]|uniref:5'-3' exoribonuclease n=1 Tax=Giardia muris TaxID=5742 RepID=A0A4Z1T948_GIAMU|nr:5'-3' exoribonuclease 2 [Giardia muris]|eukprot:TNJ29049.1 5'-3' exoribonuclease 2 [Giardia muris]
MGVPSFFRWIQERYPHVIQDVPEAAPNTPEADIDSGGTPLGFAIDNLYIDTNGLIHPCFHPENREGPKTEEEVFEEIFAYLDRLVNICRPRRLLYLAIDGPAPRAKLNQQRSRRFTSAYERQLRAEADAARTKAEMEMRIDDDDDDDDRKTSEPPLKTDLVGDIPEESESTDELNSHSALDSNAITPGTPFMMRLSVALKWYISARQARSSLWQNLLVMYADAWSPGEGEHKIMSFIRIQSCNQGYDPSTVHCIHGLDADLIMLGLGTHETNILILREVVFMPRGAVVCNGCGQLRSTGRGRLKTRAALDHEETPVGECPYFPDAQKRPIVYSKAFQFLSVAHLREYLRREFGTEGLDFERCVDDFVFLCFLAGNDFLPHMEALSIHENAVLRIIQLYVDLRRKRRFQYVTEDCTVNFGALYYFLDELANLEPMIYKGRHDLQMKNRATRRKGKEDDYLPFRSNVLDVILKANERYDAMASRKLRPQDLAIKYFWKEYRLHDLGFRNRYYECIGLMSDTEDQKGSPEYTKILDRRVEAMCHCFLDGLAWVFAYYYKPSVEDWGWYYPYHYAPLALDLARFIRTYKGPGYQKSGRPFRPVEQLLAVMPPASADLLPASLRPLMLSSDSLLHPFYPNLISCDMSEKAQLWKGSLLLPFIDSDILLNEVSKISLTPEEKQYNGLSDSVTIIHKNHPGFPLFLAIIRDEDIPLAFQSLAQVREAPNASKTRLVLVKVTNNEYQVYSGIYSVSRMDFFALDEMLPHYSETSGVQFCRDFSASPTHASRSVYGLEEPGAHIVESILVRYVPHLANTRPNLGTRSGRKSILDTSEIGASWARATQRRRDQIANLLGGKTE